MIKNFYRALSILTKDKVILSLAFLPVLIGATLYFYLGVTLYKFIVGEGKVKIASIIGTEFGSGFVYGILIALFSAVLFFIFNWTFVLLVSVIASPFNDLISSRVERKYTSLAREEEKFSLKKFIKSVLKTIWNETKKVSFIMALTLIALALSIFPVLAPLSFILSALLMAIQFIDYSWGRHEWSLRKCVKDSFKHSFSYILGGAAFIFIMAIPGANLVGITVGVIYFTLIWAEKNGPQISKTQPPETLLETHEGD